MFMNHIIAKLRIVLALTLAPLIVVTLGSEAAAQPADPEPPADKPAADEEDKATVEDEKEKATEEEAEKPKPEAPAEKPEAPAEKPKAEAPAEKPKAEAPAEKPKAEVDEATEAAASAEQLDWRDYVRLKLGPIELYPIALVALQASPWVGEDSFYQAGDIAEQGGFRLRRARFGFGGEVAKSARFSLSGQLSSDEDGELKIRDAWAGFTRWEFIQAFAGAHRVPYSRSGITSTGNHALIEAPLAVRAMAPSNQVGMTLGGSIGGGAFGYTVGLFNGFQRQDQFYAGFVENYSPFGNRFDGLAYAARLSTEPLGRLDPFIADERHSDFRFGGGASYFFSDGGARDLHAVSGDVLAHFFGVHILQEVLWTLAEPESVPTQASTQIEQVISFASVSEAGYMILENMLGVAVRFEWIDPITVVEDEGDNWLITGGATFQVIDRLLRLQADYTHREERFGLSLANDSVTLQFQLKLSDLGIPKAAAEEKATDSEAILFQPARF